MTATESETMEATFIKRLTDFRGDARLYRLSQPHDVKDWADEVGVTVDHIIISGVDAYGGPETYVFPADSSGEIVSWVEIAGSFQGDIDHQRALDGFLASLDATTATE